MFIFSFKLSKEKIVTAMCICLALFGLGIFFFNRNSQSVSVKLSETRAETPEQRLEYITSLGWQVSPEPVSVQELTVPSEFDSVYKDYSNMLKSAGYSLEKYRGKAVTKYTYTVNNYPDTKDPVVLNLLVSGNKVIGGDIGSAKLGGFLKELSYNNSIASNSTQSQSTKSSSKSIASGSMQSQSVTSSSK